MSMSRAGCTARVPTSRRGRRCSSAPPSSATAARRTIRSSRSVACATRRARSACSTARAPRSHRGDLEVAAFGGVVPDPLSGKPDTSATRFGGEVIYDLATSGVAAARRGHRARLDVGRQARRAAAVGRRVRESRPGLVRRLGRGAERSPPTIRGARARSSSPARARAASGARTAGTSASISRSCAPSGRCGSRPPCRPSGCAR